MCAFKSCPKRITDSDSDNLMCLSDLLRCNCAKGYAMDDITKQCVNINECLVDNNPCKSSVKLKALKNTFNYGDLLSKQWGTCFNGYCERFLDRWRFSRCTDTPGSFKCSCGAEMWVDATHERPGYCEDRNCVRGYEFVAPSDTVAWPGLCRRVNTCSEGRYPHHIVDAYRYYIITERYTNKYPWRACGEGLQCNLTETEYVCSSARLECSGVREDDKNPYAPISIRGYRPICIPDCPDDKLFDSVIRACVSRPVLVIGIDGSTVESNLTCSKNELFCIRKLELTSRNGFVAFCKFDNTYLDYMESLPGEAIFIPSENSHLDKVLKPPLISDYSFSSLSIGASEGLIFCLPFPEIMSFYNYTIIMQQIYLNEVFSNIQTIPSNIINITLLQPSTPNVLLQLQNKCCMTLILHCNDENIGLKSYRFLRNNVYISQNQNNKTMVLERVTWLDSGNYTCELTMRRKLSKSLGVFVNIEDINSTVILADGLQVIDEQIPDFLLLKSLHDWLSTFYNNKYQTFRYITNLDFRNKRNSSYNIHFDFAHDLNASKFNNDYLLDATNVSVDFKLNFQDIRHTARPPTPCLSVYPDDSFFLSGQSVNLTCNVSSIGSFGFVFVHGNKTFFTKNSYFAIMKTNSSTSGEYFCYTLVDNIKSLKSTSVNITVVPYFTKVDIEVAIRTHNLVHITFVCEIHALVYNNQIQKHRISISDKFTGNTTALLEYKTRGPTEEPSFMVKIIPYYDSYYDSRMLYTFYYDVSHLYLEERIPAMQATCSVEKNGVWLHASAPVSFKYTPKIPDMSVDPPGVDPGFVNMPSGGRVTIFCVNKVPWIHPIGKFKHVLIKNHNGAKFSITKTMKYEEYYIVTSKYVIRKAAGRDSFHYKCKFSINGISTNESSVFLNITDVKYNFVFARLVITEFSDRLLDGGKIKIQHSDFRTDEFEDLRNMITKGMNYSMYPGFQKIDDFHFNNHPAGVEVNFTVFFGLSYLIYPEIMTHDLERHTRSTEFKILYNYTVHTGSYRLMDQRNAQIRASIK